MCVCVFSLLGVMFHFGVCGMSGPSLLRCVYVCQEKQWVHSLAWPHPQIALANQRSASGWPPPLTSERCHVLFKYILLIWGQSCPMILFKNNVKKEIYMMQQQHCFLGKSSSYTLSWRILKWRKQNQHWWPAIYIKTHQVNSLVLTACLFYA